MTLPELSLDAFQASETDVMEVAVTRRLPGVVGRVRSAADATAGISKSTVKASASARHNMHFPH